MVVSAQPEKRDTRKTNQMDTQHIYISNKKMLFAVSCAYSKSGAFDISQKLSFFFQAVITV